MCVLEPTTICLSETDTAQLKSSFMHWLLFRFERLNIFSSHDVVSYYIYGAELKNALVRREISAKKTVATKTTVGFHVGEGGTLQVVYPGVHQRYGFFMTDTPAARCAPRASYYSRFFRIRRNMKYAVKHSAVIATARIS